MKVLVDTSIWSLAFRRKRTSEKPVDLNLSELSELIREVRAVLIGPIRQEVLSGISSEPQFERLKEKLSSFEDLDILRADYQRAASFFNTCRRKGVQGSHIDFLICAVAYRCQVPIFTTDKDFELYSRHIDIALHHPRRSLN